VTPPDAPRGSVPLAWPPPAVVLAPLLMLALVLAAPPLGPWWGLDGWRSLPPGPALALALVALGAGALALRPPPPRAWPAVAVPLALLIAFPLRERLHLLGDTWLRVRQLDLQAAHRIVPLSSADVARLLHTQPLDQLAGIEVPLALMRLGMAREWAVSAVSFALALLYLTALWSVVRREEDPPGLRVPLFLALAAGGTLEVFAGYAESGGVVAASTVWLWSRTLPPLDRTRRVIALAAAWAVALLSHRLALALAPVLLWRLLGPARPGDRRGARRAALAACALVLVPLLLRMRAAGDLGPDLATLLAELRGAGVRLTPARDVFDLALLVMPLALLAPALAGRAALARWARGPRAVPLALAALALAPMFLCFPVAPRGLGAFCDWELPLMPGVLLTLGAASLLGAAAPARRRVALVLALPVLTLLAGGWWMAHADRAVSERRALWLAGTPTVGPDVRRHVLLVLGYQASDAGRPAAAAACFERAFGESPNPRDALLATAEWLRAGEPAAARRALAAARARGPLSPDLEVAAATYQAELARLERALASPADPAR
jgi:hypothetical protein